MRHTVDLCPYTSHYPALLNIWQPRHNLNWVQPLNPAPVPCGKPITHTPCSAHDFSSPSLKQCRSVNRAPYFKTAPQIHLQRADSPITVLSLPPITLPLGLVANISPWLGTSPGDGPERKAERVHRVHRKDAHGWNTEKFVWQARNQSVWI